MRWLVLVLAACTTTTSRSSLERWPTVTQDKLVIVVERVETTTSKPLLFGDPADHEYDEERTGLGAAEIDLLTGACVWRDGAKRRNTLDVAGFTKTDDGSILVQGRPVDVPAFPVGALVAVAPGRAVFASPFGAIVFDGAHASWPLRGVVPPRATTTWWHAKRSLAVGETIYTPIGFAVRVEKDALEIRHARERRRVPITATSVVYFEGTELVATSDEVVDVAHDDDVLRDVAVANLLQYEGKNQLGVYFQLTDGHVMHADLPFKIRDAKPVTVRMNLIAIRGRHFVFNMRDTLFIFDGTWRWHSYGDCLP
jgi:hypothetical protein